MRLEVLWRDGGDDTIILEDLQGCFEIEGVMRSNGIVDVLPVFKVFVVFGKILGEFAVLIPPTLFGNSSMPRWGNSSGFTSSMVKPGTPCWTRSVRSVSEAPLRNSPGLFSIQPSGTTPLIPISPLVKVLNFIAVSFSFS